jgi:CheY-like chemotaxis protein
MFFHWGLDPVLAENGEAALHLLDSDPRCAQPFDFVLVDFHMPGIDSFEFIRRYNQRRSSKYTGILMLTSLDHQRFSSRHNRSGIRHYLTKPVLAADLLHAMLQSLEGFSLAEAGVLAPVIAPVPKRRLKVLLVEDNVVNRKLVSTILTKAGHDVVTASDGRAAIALYSDASPDVILMDLQMPIMGGYESATEIRRIEKGPNRVPIIALTANAMPETQAQCLRSGMDSYVTKPMNPGHLMRVIQSLTDC